MRHLVVGLLVCTLGCAGMQLKPTGMGVSVTDPSGVDVAKFEVNLPAIIAKGMTWLMGHVSDLGGTETQTGPAPVEGE